MSAVPRFVVFLMIRRPPRSTLDRSSAASDVYKRQVPNTAPEPEGAVLNMKKAENQSHSISERRTEGDLCLLYTSPSPRDRTRSRMPSSA